ncbi:hypothetical protein [Flavobacterium sp.]|uniref:hypothetical protein n=1 Tax=Flavobacterium sp. TaxID=239 RepID=UPI002B4B3D61|nr:hypothetical protein [Flavobacterium sp.]HLF52701.1 hypothetical protein [Flavobacterium sp.]
MGLFGNNVKKIVQEFRKKSEHYSNDMSKEINEFLEDLKSDYEENSSILPEFVEFVEELKHKLDPKDAHKLVEFSSRLVKIKRCAKKGVEAMVELSKDHKKLARESFRDFEEYAN